MAPGRGITGAVREFKSKKDRSGFGFLTRDDGGVRGGQTLRGTPGTIRCVGPGIFWTSTP